MWTFGPIQGALFPDIEEPGEDQCDKNGHLDEGEQPQFPVYHRPRVQEDGFDIKENEKHPHQVELDAESLPGRTGRRDAALIRQIFDPVPDLLAE